MLMSNEAHCYKVYRDVRSGFRTGLEVGQGINEFPMSSSCLVLLRNILDFTCLHGRINDYSGEVDRNIEYACAELIKQIFDIKNTTGKVVFTNGGSEAINLCVGALARQGLYCSLPQPSYYIYEQSVIDHGVPIRYRYRSSPFRIDQYFDKGEFFNVLTEPNPLDGSLRNLNELGSLLTRSSFDIYDSVFQMPHPRQAKRFYSTQAENINLLNFDSSALLLTPSKDLSIPGFRAGIIYTNNADLLEYISDDFRSRIFSISPMVSLICLLYLSVVRITKAMNLEGRNSARQRIVELQELLSSVGVADWLDLSALWHLCEEMVAMASHCLLNHEALCSLSPIFPSIQDDGYVVGFSTFPKLKVSLSSHRELVGWANEFGREHKIFFNPSVIFGGTFESWDALYPREMRVRINLSLSKKQFEYGIHKIEEVMSTVTDNI